MNVKEKEVMNRNIWKFGLYNFIDHIRMIWMIKTLFLLWLGFNFTNMSIHESILALVIFLFEVPLGALADFIGKRKAIIISASGYFFEILDALYVRIKPDSLGIPPPPRTII